MIRRPIPEQLRRLSSAPRPEDLLSAVRCATDVEMEAICRLFIAEGVPAVFIARPIEYENLRVTIAAGLGISGQSIGLLGSARTGYSLHPKRFPRDFSDTSRLDFFVVDRVVFEECLNDASQWRKDVESGERMPRNDRQRVAWETVFSNMDEIQDRGYFDPIHFFENEEYRRVWCYVSDYLRGFVPV